MSREIPSDFARILAAGNSAPSGENCQPWHFFLHAHTIQVHLLPTRDQSAYSWGQRASYLANGAAIENMVIAASKEKYRAEVQYFPTADDVWHIATISLSKDISMKTDPLVSCISTRIVNRKLYVKRPLTHEEQEAFFSTALESEYGTFALTEKSADIEQLGRVGSTNEEVMLANRSLHAFFFSHVSWTKEEDEKKKIGFYIKTLELPPPAQVMFKIFRHWSIMRVLAAIGFNRIVARQNGATNASSAAIGALMIDSTNAIDFVKAGRTVERLWLTATALGLSLQPITGVLFFKLRIDAEDSSIFSLREQKLIKDAYQKASKIFKAEGKHIAFMFRVGRGDTPSAQAIRFPLDEVVSVV
jgi:nitroreductase